VHIYNVFSARGGPQALFISCLNPIKFRLKATNEQGDCVLAEGELTAFPVTGRNSPADWVGIKEAANTNLFICSGAVRRKFGQH
jgi:hypothetical protein